MAVTRKPRPASQPSEAIVQRLISKGGSAADRPTDAPTAVLVRFPASMLAEIDAAVQRRRPVRISRQSWIIEACLVRLQQETPSMSRDHRIRINPGQAKKGDSDADQA